MILFQHHWFVHSLCEVEARGEYIRMELRNSAKLTGEKLLDIKTNLKELMQTLRDKCMPRNVTDSLLRRRQSLHQWICDIITTTDKLIKVRSYPVKHVLNYRLY